MIDAWRDAALTGNLTAIKSILPFINNILDVSAAISTAAFHNHIAIVYELLNNKPHAPFVMPLVDKEGSYAPYASLIGIATHTRNALFLSELTNHYKQDPNSIVAGNCTALLFSMSTTYEIVVTLLSAGASPNLGAALSIRREQVVVLGDSPSSQSAKAFIQSAYEANKKVEITSGTTPLQLARKKDDIICIAFLIAYGVTGISLEEKLLKEECPIAGTALAVLCASGFINEVDRLLKLGADPYHEHGNGTSTFDSPFLRAICEKK